MSRRSSLPSAPGARPVRAPRDRGRRRAAALAAVAALAFAGLAAPALGAPADDVAAAPDGAIRVIVELGGDPALAQLGAERTAAAQSDAAFAADYAAARDALLAEQDAVVAAAASAGVTMDVVHRITGVLHTVVADVPADAVPALRDLPDVVAVTPDETVHAATEASVPATGAPDVWEQPDPDGTPLRGTGVTVAVVDSGVDYTLPDLGGGFGEGFRVVDGADYVDDDGDPQDLNGHGTHVAGIVAGSGAESVTGVAPDATLTAYRVLDRRGSGSLADVIAGIEAAVDPLGEHPADVVNLSLAGPGDGTDPLGRAASAAAEAGVVVVAAAGNAGPTEGTVTSPASAAGVLAVGATTTGLVEARLDLLAPSARTLDTWRIPMSANAPDVPIDAPFVDVGDGTESDYDRVGDVTGAVVVYSGNTPRNLADLTGRDLAQARLAEERGALAALVYEPGATGQDAEPPVQRADVPDGAPALAEEPIRCERLVVLGTTNAEVQALLDAIAAEDAKATISAVDLTGTTAEFSARGPGPDLGVGPDLLAPGVEIRSLVPASFGAPGNTWRYSGTSQAAPHAAGAAALVRQARPDAGQEAVRAALVGSARPSGASSPLADGAGVLDAAAAVAAHVTARPAVVDVGLADTDGPTDATASVTLTNTGAEATTAQLSVVASDGSRGAASVTPSSVEIPAGGSVDVTLEVAVEDAPVAAEASGRIVAELSSGDVVQVPFAQLVRPPTVRASPDPAAGSTRVVVQSAVTLDAAPDVEVTAPSGATSTVPTHAIEGRPGWYAATVELAELGEHALAVRADSGGAAQHGAGTLASVEASGAGAWEPLGRNASSARLAVSEAAPGTAMLTLDAMAMPFVTTDHGATWTRLRDVPIAGGDGFAFADPDDGEAFWYAVNGKFGKGMLDPTYRGMVLRTEDLGQTWRILPFPDQYYERFTASGDTLVAVVADGLQRSVDGGETWQLVPVPWGETVYGVSIVGTDVLVEQRTRVVRVAGAGEPGGPPPRGGEPTLELESSSLVATTTGDGAAWAVSRSGDVWRSDDGGATWAVVGHTTLGYASGMWQVDGVLYLTGLGRTASSADGGATWTETPFPVRGPLAADVAAWPDRPGSLLLSLRNAGVYASEDGGATYPERLGVPALTVEDVVVSAGPDGSDVLWVGDTHGLATLPVTDAALVDPDPEWGVTGAEGLLGVAVRDVEPVSPSEVWRLRIDANGIGHLEHSVDAGDSFAEVRMPQISMGDLAASPADRRSLAIAYASAGGDRGLFMTSDSWESYDVVPVPGQVRDMAYDPGDPRVLWVASTSGLYRVSGADRAVERRLDEPVASVHLVPDPDAPRPRASAIVAGGFGLWRSDDGGATFDAATTPSGSGAIRALTSATVHGRTVLVAGSAASVQGELVVSGRGVLLSTDGGATWVSASSGLTVTSVLTLAASSDGRWLFAGTQEGGAFRASLADLLDGTQD